MKKKKRKNENQWREIFQKAIKFDQIWVRETSITTWRHPDSKKDSITRYYQISIGSDVCNPRWKNVAPPWQPMIPDKSHQIFVTITGDKIEYNLVDHRTWSSNIRFKSEFEQWVINFIKEMIVCYKMGMYQGEAGRHYQVK